MEAASNALLAASNELRVASAKAKSASSMELFIIFYLPFVLIL